MSCVSVLVVGGGSGKPAGRRLAAAVPRGCVCVTCCWQALSEYTVLLRKTGGGVAVVAECDGGNSVAWGGVAGSAVDCAQLAAAVGAAQLVAWGGESLDGFQCQHLRPYLNSIWKYRSGFGHTPRSKLRQPTAAASCAQSTATPPQALRSQFPGPCGKRR